MLAGLGVLVAFCQPEVDNIDDVLALANPDEEIVRLDVAVEETAGVREFNALDLRREQAQSTIWSAIISTVFRVNLRLQ